jgi:hypothetical protein
LADVNRLLDRGGGGFLLLQDIALAFIDARLKYMILIFSSCCYAFL